MTQSVMGAYVARLRAGASPSAHKNAKYVQVLSKLVMLAKTQKHKVKMFAAIWRNKRNRLKGVWEDDDDVPPTEKKGELSSQQKLMRTLSWLR
jgi:hypothetical protein